MHTQGGVVGGAQRLNAGIDVSKQHLDVCCGTEEPRLANDAQGWDAAAAMLLRANVDLVVVEATGGYERGLVCALQGAEIVVARVNPRQARDFAKSMGVLAKTDSLDAHTLRDYADVLARHQDRAKFITPLMDEERQVLAALMTRRRQLVDMRVAESQRMEHANARALKSIRSVVKMLDRQIAEIDRDIDDHMDRHFKPQRKLLDSVGLESFVRTSGGKGLHVVVPLKPGCDWDLVKPFAHAFADGMAKVDPLKYVSTSSKRFRNNKIFVDYLRNGRGATSVASFSLRARPGAPVAMPLRWEELGKVKSGTAFDIKSALARISRLRKHPWAGIERVKQDLSRWSQ